MIVSPAAANRLPDTFDFSTALDDSLKNKLYMSFDSISGKGFQTVSLGDAATTTDINIEGDENAPAVLEAAVLNLAAKGTVTVNPYVTLYGSTSRDESSGEGRVNITAPGVSLAENSGVKATHLISLDVNDVQDISGRLTVEAGAIELKSANIYFGEADSSPSGGATGLHVTDDVLNKFSGFENISFTAKKDIQFLGDATLFAPASLTLDAARILDMNAAGASAVTVTAPAVNIQNSLSAASSTSVPSAKTDKGTFSVNASAGINAGSGRGDIVFGGFASIDLSAANDAVFKGKGSLTTSDADLNISAARVITAAGSTSDADYVAPYFLVNAGTGNIAMTASGQTASSASVAGGLLEMTGNSVKLATVLRSDAGTIKLAATNGIAVNDGGRILVRGTDDSPGGEAALSAATGAVALASGSLIDVSAGAQGDAGGITLLASTGGVTIAGDIQGQAADGSGGSLTLDTNALADFAALNDKKIITGGFTESLDLRQERATSPLATIRGLLRNKFELRRMETTSMFQEQLTHRAPRAAWWSFTLKTMST